MYSKSLSPGERFGFCWACYVVRAGNFIKYLEMTSAGVEMHAQCGGKFSSFVLGNFGNNQFSSISHGLETRGCWQWTALMEMEEKPLVGRRRQWSMDEQNQGEEMWQQSSVYWRDGGNCLPLSVKCGARCWYPVFLMENGRCMANPSAFACHLYEGE